MTHQPHLPRPSLLLWLPTTAGGGLRWPLWGIQHLTRVLTPGLSNPQHSTDQTACVPWSPPGPSSHLHWKLSLLPCSVQEIGITSPQASHKTLLRPAPPVLSSTPPPQGSYPSPRNWLEMDIWERECVVSPKPSFLFLPFKPLAQTGSTGLLASLTKWPQGALSYTCLPQSAASGLVPHPPEGEALTTTYLKTRNPSSDFLLLSAPLPRADSTCPAPPRTPLPQAPPFLLPVGLHHCTGPSLQKWLIRLDFSRYCPGLEALSVLKLSMPAN